MEKMIDALELINYQKKLLKQKEDQIKQLEYEHELIEKDIVVKIKDRLFYSEYNKFRYSYATFAKVQAYCNKKVELSDEELKDYECAFNTVTKDIKENILLNDSKFKLENITNYWHGTAFNFYYKYKTYNIQIVIPLFESVNNDNYPTMLEGYVVYYEYKPNCWEAITYGFDLEKIANDLKQWLEVHNEQHWKV